MASGNTLAIFMPADNEPPASNYATFDLRNGHPILNFDADTQESAVFSGVMPSHYSGGGLTLDLFWTGTGTSNNVVWDAAWEELDPDNNDIDADVFGSAFSVISTANATSGKIVRATVSISHVDAGRPSAGDPFRLRIRRAAADTADTMSGDAELLAVHCKES